MPNKLKNKILVLNGPNLNLLGTREKSIYGKFKLSDINKELKTVGKKEKFNVYTVQTNHEGEIIDRIQKAGKDYDGILINAGAFTHTSVAIRDAIAAIKIPVIDVHISNIYKREEFRKRSLIVEVCKGQVCGFGTLSYKYALKILIDLLKAKR